MDPSLKHEFLESELMDFRRYCFYSNKRISKSWRDYREEQLLEQMSDLWYSMSAEEQDEATKRCAYHQRELNQMRVK